MHFGAVLKFRSEIFRSLLHIIKCLWLPPKKLSKQEAPLWKCHVIFWALPSSLSFFSSTPVEGPAGVLALNQNPDRSEGAGVGRCEGLCWVWGCARRADSGESLFPLIFALFSPASALLTHAPAAVSLCNTLILLLLQGKEWSVWWRACHTFYMRHLRILATSNALKRLLRASLSQVCTHTVRAVAFSIPLSRL